MTDKKPEEGVDVNGAPSAYIREREMAAEIESRGINTLFASHHEEDQE
jgi:hypothetical protein